MICPNFYFQLPHFELKRLVIIACVLMLFHVHLITSIYAGDPPDGFEEVEVLTNLESPAGFAFSPDGRMFICERITGALRVAEFNIETQEWELAPIPFYTFDVPKEGGIPARHRSSGLRDIAFDPDFESNGYIYAFYMGDEPRQNRVTRIQSSPNDPNMAELGSEVVLLDVPYNTTASSGSHNGGAIEFGADGMLYITTGDGWNGGDVVQSLNTFTGKVLRINKDGSIPQDNPFYSQASGTYRSIFALGLRNPYSMTRHPETGELYINEAGGDRKASIFIAEAGANYGHQGFAGIGAQKSEWGNGAVGANGILITGGAWYPQDGYWPSEYHGAYFTALWGTNNNQTGDINFLESRTSPVISAFMTSVGQSGLKPVLTRIGPDGNLYYVLTNYESNKGRIHMVRWTGQESVASPDINPPGGTFAEPVEVSLNSNTSDAIIRYTLDGSMPDGSSFLYTNPLQISESTVLNARAFKDGLLPSSTASGNYVIGSTSNIPPVAHAGEDQTVVAGEFVTLSAAASFDPDGDDLTLSWQWRQLDGPTVELFSAEDAIAFFTPNDTGTYLFQISVQDQQDVSTDLVSIVVEDELPLGFGLVGYWQLDEASGVNAADSLGGRNGILVNGPVWRPSGGAVSGALEFDGIDDYVDLGPLEEVSGEGLTFSLWMRADDFEIHDARFISKATGIQDDDHYWMLSTLNETALRFRLKTDGNVTTLISRADELVAGTWYHIAATYDGNEMKLFKDGSLVASTPKNGTVDTDPRVIAVLGNQPPGNGERAFDGMIDDVRIYNRPLSGNAIGILANGEVSLSSSDTPLVHGLASLLPNHPNPVSTQTTIPYHIERTGAVQLELFDVTGRRIATLVDEIKTPGRYEVIVDASGLPSGVYMYRLMDTGRVESRLFHVLR